MPDLTLPQAQVIADAAAGRCWHYHGGDYATGTHSDRNVSRTVAALLTRDLLTKGEQQPGGHLWRPTKSGYWAARGALNDLATRVDITRKLLDRWEGAPDA